MTNDNILYIPVSFGHSKVAAIAILFRFQFNENEKKNCKNWKTILLAYLSTF